MKICWKFTHLQAIQDVDEYGSSLEQTWKNVALHNVLANRSSAVNGCRQNESPNSWESKQILQFVASGWTPESRKQSIISLPPATYSVPCYLLATNITSVVHAFACKCCLICAHFSPDSDKTTFFTEENNIMDRGLVSYKHLAFCFTVC